MCSGKVHAHNKRMKWITDFEKSPWDLQKHRTTRAAAEQDDYEAGQWFCNMCEALELPALPRALARQPCSTFPAWQMR